MTDVSGCTVVTTPTGPDPTYFGPTGAEGGYVAVVGLFPPGEPAPPFHTHPSTDEGFYVAEGQATFQLGDRELSVGAGTFVFVPRGTPHTVWNSGDGPVHGLLLISPGNVEHEFVPATPSG